MSQLFANMNAQFYRYVGNAPVNWLDPNGLVPTTNKGKCLTEFDKCFVNEKNTQLDELCVLKCCDYNYNLCRTLKPIKAGTYFREVDPSNYCDANGQIAPFEKALDDPNESSVDNYGKTDISDFEEKKNNQPEICVAKTVAGECEACFANQGQLDRISECKGF